MVLVTGATGFLGSELVKQLIAKGYPVRAMKRESSVIPALLKNEAGIEWVSADVLDYFSLQEAMEGISEVFHCAALVSFEASDRKKMHKVNVEGTANVVNLCMEMNIRKLVHVSSVAALGEPKAGLEISEANHWEYNGTQTAYSISKYESEMEVFRGIAEGLDAVIVNPSIILGRNAGNEGSGQLFETVRKGLKYYPGGSCGLVDVQDVAQIMILLMESEISGQRFILNSENYSYKKLFSEIAIQMGRKAPSFALKPWMLNLAYYASSAAKIFGNKTAITRDIVQSAFNTPLYSNAKIKAALGINFKPVKTSIAEVIN